MAVNEAPTMTIAYSGLNLEGRAAGSLWAALHVDDPEGDAVSLTIVDQTLVRYTTDPITDALTILSEEGGREDFYLSGGQIRASRTFDYDADGYHAYYKLTVHAIDSAGNGSDLDIVLGVRDVKEVSRAPAIPATFSGTSGVDEIYGNGRNEVFYGREGNDILVGGGGNDKLYGGADDDTLRGGDGKDMLYGGGGQDDLYGGAGADLFVFKSAIESVSVEWQTIQDFSLKEHDKIDLRFMDADTGKAGRQDFHFIGTDRFSGEAGELRFHKFATGTAIAADTDGDGYTDLWIRLQGQHDVTKDYFLL